MPASRRQPNCLNCGAPTPDAFCAQCGQRNTSLHASFWELAADLLGEALEADSRIARTIRPFLFKPGFLTAEHAAGRRVRYSSPLRLYLFCSFAFFLTLSLSGQTAVGEGRDGGFQLTFGGAADAGSEPGTPPSPSDEEQGDPGVDAGSAPAAGGGSQRADDPHVTGLGPFNQRIEQRIREVKQMKPAEREAFVERLRREFFNHLPKVVFLLLPLFALLLKAFSGAAGASTSST